MRILPLFLWVVSAAALVPDGPRACPPPKQPVKQERQPSAGGAAVVSTAVALALAAHTGAAPPALATAPNEYGSAVFTANKGGRIISLDVDVNKVVVLAKTKAVQNEVLDVAKALSPALKATPPDDVKGFLFELLGGRARGSINGEPVELDYKLEPGAISLTVRSRFIPSKPRDLLAPLLAKTPPGKIDFAKGRVASDKGDPQGTSLEQTLGKALSEAEALGLVNMGPGTSRGGSGKLAALVSADAWLKPRDLLLGQSVAALGGATVASVAALYAWSYSLYTGELAAEAAATAAKKKKVKKASPKSPPAEAKPPPAAAEKPPPATAEKPTPPAEAKPPPAAAEKPPPATAEKPTPFAKWASPAAEAKGAAVGEEKVVAYDDQVPAVLAAETRAWRDEAAAPEAATASDEAPKKDKEKKKRRWRYLWLK